MSPNGLTLYFSRLKSDATRSYELVVSTRPTRDAAWTKPQPVPLACADEGNVAWCFIASDALTMLAAHMNKERQEKGNLMFWWRGSTNELFTRYSYIQIKGSEPIAGVSPRWVKATNELFFTKVFPARKKSLTVVFGSSETSCRRLT